MPSICSGSPSHRKSRAVRSEEAIAVWTIPGALRRAESEFGDSEAIVDGSARVTFAELANRAEVAARSLVASGVAPGDRVAIWAPNGLEWIVASFGIYLAGAVLVPLNTRFRGAEAGYILRTCGARLLLGTTDCLGTDLLSLLDGVDTGSVTETVVLSGPPSAGRDSWNGFLGRAAEVDPRTVHDRESALGRGAPSDIIFTSGTTGSPKGAVLTHDASVRTYLAWSDRVGLRRGDRYLIVYPFFHTAGLKSGVLACVLLGATIIPESVFDVGTVMKKVAEERVTVLPGPPTVFQSILDHPDFETFDMSGLRLSVTGAAVVPVEIVRAMRNDLGIATVVTGYGLTETTGTVSMCRHDDPPEVVAETVGRPIEGVEVRIVDENGKRVAAGEQGEIEVRGFNVMKEYFSDPEATAAAISSDGWLHTGDVGCVDDSGNIRITDRKKDMFIVGGFNVYPAEVEKIMQGHPSLSQVAVVGMPDQRLGEVGVGFVVARSGTRPTEDEVISWCRANMANYKVPREIRFVESLPLNPSGKVLKFVLRDQVGR